jgi:hypothetical protein
MSFLNRAKAAAEQVRVKAQEGVEEVQAKKELAQAYWDVGHKAHELAARGEISHPELDPLVQRISDLEARDGSSGPSPAGTAEPSVETEQAAGTTPPQTPA